MLELPKLISRGVAFPVYDVTRLASGPSCETAKIQMASGQSGRTHWSPGSIPGTQWRLGGDEDGVGRPIAIPLGLVRAAQ